MDRFFGRLHCPVRKNLALLEEAFVTLTVTLRSGRAELTLAAVARALPLPTAFKDRYERPNRFLDNRLFGPHGLSEGVFAVLLGTAGLRRRSRSCSTRSPVGAPQLLLAGLPLAGRILPLGLMPFTHADIHSRRERERSQNFLERCFFLRLLAAAPLGLEICFILDRGYARLSLLRELLAEPRACFLLRTRRDVVIEPPNRGGWTRCRIGSLPARHGQPRGVEPIRSRGWHPIEVDLVIYGGRGHKEPWYLVVPPGPTLWLPTAEVVSLDRRRMHLEQDFRDLKPHLWGSGACDCRCLSASGGSGGSWPSPSPMRLSSRWG